MNGGGGECGREGVQLNPDGTQLLELIHPPNGILACSLPRANEQTLQGEGGGGGGCKETSEGGGGLREREGGGRVYSSTLTARSCWS